MNIKRGETPSFFPFESISAPAANAQAAGILIIPQPAQFVKRKTRKKLNKEAKLYFDEPHYICEFSDVEAEMSGLDEY